jgi:hypothetical protein
MVFGIGIENPAGWRRVRPCDFGISAHRSIRRALHCASPPMEGMVFEIVIRRFRLEYSEMCVGA